MISRNKSFLSYRTAISAPKHPLHTYAHFRLDNLSKTNHIKHIQAKRNNLFRCSHPRFNRSQAAGGTQMGGAGSKGEKGRKMIAINSGPDHRRLAGWPFPLLADNTTPSHRPLSRPRVRVIGSRTTEWKLIGQFLFANRCTPESESGEAGHVKACRWHVQAHV